MKNNMQNRDSLAEESMFIGRENELKRLEKMDNSGKFEFAIIYGRRRVGKTTLISHFIDGRKAIFFACQNASKEDNLVELSSQISSFTGYSLNFTSFIDAVRTIIKLAEKERLIFVMDEFPYLAKRDDNAASSALQNLIDNEGKKSKLFLILCGSSLSFMEDSVLGKESPLYGRATGVFRLQPFDYLDSAKFVPSYCSSDKALVYGITGGIPRYLELFDDSVSVKENLLFNLFDSNSVLFNERESCLKEEFKEVSTYNSILSAIASGCTKLTHIADRADIQVGSLPKYLSNLAEVGIIDKLVPLGEKESKGIWRISDLFFRFYFFFVPRNYSTIISSRMGKSYDLVVEPLLNDYMGKVFEEIVKQYIEKYASLPFPLQEIGTWWGGSRRLKKEIEIDVVASSAVSREKIAASVKFREKVLPLSDLDLMREYSLEMDGSCEYHYWFFSKSGFSEDLRRMEGEKIHLFSIDDIYSHLS